MVPAKLVSFVAIAALVLPTGWCCGVKAQPVESAHARTCCEKTRPAEPEPQTVARCCCDRDAAKPRSFGGDDLSTPSLTLLLAGWEAEPASAKAAACDGPLVQRPVRILFGVWRC
jgi:hypothetical protein